MTHAKAIEIVQAYTGKPLLESLEQIQAELQDISRKDVRVAYHTLMAGFTDLLG